jgi:hypothetical protein
MMPMISRKLGRLPSRWLKMIDRTPRTTGGKDQEAGSRADEGKDKGKKSVRDAARMHCCRRCFPATPPVDRDIFEDETK